ncbi:hypothetical protein [Calothrix sp. NIES-2098]|uniref:hypothetical protein n=1 Tax=Calothrix sp. NIES-2098 TaxID=1954171 RepID=UPI000B5F64E3|nr:hypothetical protein NIES2098_72610 [Calothrix sp. NIES-2098]
MDFINQAQKLASQVRDKVQEVATNATNSLDEVVDGIKNTTVEITTSSINAVADLQGLSTTAAKVFKLYKMLARHLKQLLLGLLPLVWL